MMIAVILTATTAVVIPFHFPKIGRFLPKRKCKSVAGAFLVSSLSTGHFENAAEGAGPPWNMEICCNLEEWSYSNCTDV